MNEINVLVLTEVLEFVCPIAYLACFVACYYGPNAEILGNVKNGYWQYQGVEDIDAAITNLYILIFIDLLSLIIPAVVLWLKYQINLTKVKMG